MNKEQFLKLFEECLNEGLIDIEHEKGLTLYGNNEPDIVKIKIKDKTVKKIYV